MTQDDITVVLRVLAEVSAGRMTIQEAVPILTDLADAPIPCPHCGQRPNDPSR
jgi:hypothetical protein